MNFTPYKRTLLSWKTLKKFVAAFLQVFGAIALFLGVIATIFPKVPNYGFAELAVFGGASLFWGCIAIVPGREISRQLTVPDTKITVKVGDLFLQNAHLVIGINDVFDTEKGDIIKPTSIQGQFLTKVYNDDRQRLDKDINDALQGILGQVDPQKARGKNIRYPIGTVVTLTVGTKKYFCSAYSRMGNDLRAQSDISRLSTSLEKLWEEIRVRGQGETVAMAVIGSDLARVGNTVSHSNLIKLIVSLFIIASREKWITHELAIIIHPSQLEKVNLIDLNEFLQNF